MIDLQPRASRLDFVTDSDPELDKGLQIGLLRKLGG